MRTGAEQIDSLKRDLACPQCEYDLRGLPGDRFHCPECGLEIDVAELAMRRWIGAWWKAPGFEQILAPVPWAVGGVMLGGVASIVFRHGVEGRTTSAVGTALVVLVVAAMWLRRFVGLREVLPDGEARRLSLFAHLLFAGYVSSSWGIVGGVIYSVNHLDSLKAIPALVVAGVMTGVFWLCRKGERYIAERCIRHHLAVQGAR